ncbi:MAG: glycoside hydrolase family 13 protein [Kiritimatiellae bacterium]|nr:glycoside hydrolase family 13 protein [Kiritimatiellia bacterium]
MKRSLRAAKPKVRVPDWAADAIWYQVFPERFRNGCPASDPRPEDMDSRPVPGWQVSPWGMDWYAQADWEKARGEFYRSVFHRRFGGDLVGLREKLDYLQDLGVNAIYLNPVFMAPSLHKYDAACLHHVDPTFGPERAGDLAKIAAANETEDPKTWIWTAADRYLVDLVADVHRRGMRIILDGVFNHVGTHFFGFRDLVMNKRNSRFQEWFRIKEWRADGTFDYQGWFNHAGLPELARTKTTLAKPVRDYIFAITRRWMDPDGDGDPADGVDGWRLDVAFCVPHGFWKSWARHVKKINAQAYTTGEVVGHADEFLQGDEFDAVMNYMWLYPTLGFFSPSPAALPASELKARLDELWRRYPRAVNYALQNLLDSHDTGRVLTFLENACPPFRDWDSYFNYPKARENPGLKTTRPGPKAMDALRQMIVFQMTCLGAPMLYYGTEVGMWGANDPDNRQPMLWDDIEHEPETRTLTGRGPSSPRKPDLDLFAFTRRAIALRKEHAVLRRGRLRWLETGNERLLAFERFDRKSVIRVWLNAGDAPADVRLERSAHDLWAGKTVRRGRLALPPRGWAVLKIHE